MTELTSNQAFKGIILKKGKSKIQRFDQYYNLDYNMYENYHLNKIKIKKNHEPC